MFTTRPELLGTFGMVASTHWLATATGMAILEKGGNAFDAAVATGLALQVVEPHLNGPGGDMPGIFHVAGEDAPRVICGQGPAPAAATIGVFEDLGLDLVPGSGLLCAVVPGAFDSWMLLLRNYGTMGLADVLSPALGFAQNGYPVVGRITATIETVRDLFEQEWPSSAAVYLPGGRAPSPGSLFSNRTLAATWSRLLAEVEAGGGSREARIDRARAIWSQGWIAESIDRFFRTSEVMDASGRRHRGLLAGDDLARWQATIEAPLSYDYGRYTVCKCGPWSQGPVLLQQLALLDGMGIGDADPVGPEFVHLVVEAAKLAFADREAWYGDPDFVDVPVEVLLSRAYAERRRAAIGPAAATGVHPGAIEGRTARIEHALRNRSGLAASPAMGTGEPTVARIGAMAGDTVHLDIIDRAGNMISCTPSGGWLQSSPVIPELGFCLGNRGQMFWLDAASPSALEPGKRPRTTLSPSLALKDGEPWMVFGTPGGDQQDQWSLLLFLHRVEHAMNLQEAIDAPAFHTEHFPSSFWPRSRSDRKLVLEGRFPAATVRELERRGHVVESGEDWSEGRLTAAAREGAVLKAAANPRGMQGYAAGR
ncbi:MAG: gamma-glutamyltransferase family protein [Alphaproteobacteria bacterium]|nr:gamma-glutamyltransferase family protein [Alphaproteobacteria bacterium]